MFIIAVTLESLTYILENSEIESRWGSFKETAHYILNLFDMNNYHVLENKLESEEIQYFWRLYTANIMTINGDETLLDKKIWRIKWWVLNEKEIKKRWKESKIKIEEKEKEFDYNELPDEAWPTN